MTTTIGWPGQCYSLLQSLDGRKIQNQTNIFPSNRALLQHELKPYTLKHFNTELVFLHLTERYVTYSRCLKTSHMEEQHMYNTYLCRLCVWRVFAINAYIYIIIYIYWITLPLASIVQHWAKKLSNQFAGFPNVYGHSVNPPVLVCCGMLLIELHHSSVQSRCLCHLEGRWCTARIDQPQKIEQVQWTDDGLLR